MPGFPGPRCSAVSVGPEPEWIVVSQVELVGLDCHEHRWLGIERAVGEINVGHHWHLLISGGLLPPVAIERASRGPRSAQGRPEDERGHGARSQRRFTADGIAVCDRGGVPQRPLNGEGVAAR